MQVWTLATQQPTFFRAAPILFPKKIMSIMPGPGDEHGDVVKKQKLLEVLEEVAKDDPWKFGFSEVQTLFIVPYKSYSLPQVMYRETRYSSLEAPLFALRCAWFYPSLSSLHKTALLTYDVFKSTCRSRGHTFLLHR